MMKKMWKMRKDKSAVSPVIATILMVAITVVLAAVLYVMVMGFGGSGGTTPTASLSATTSGSHVYKVTILSVSSTTIAISGLEVVVTGVNVTGTPAITHVGSGTALSAGDYITVTFTGVLGPATVSIRDKATSNNVASLNIQVV
jgi:archaeal type IV pilus assembly protein PilA